MYLGEGEAPDLEDTAVASPTWKKLVRPSYFNWYYKIYHKGISISCGYQK